MVSDRSKGECAVSSRACAVSEVLVGTLQRPALCALGLSLLLAAEQAFILQIPVSVSGLLPSGLYPEALAVPLAALFSLLLALIGGRLRSLDGSLTAKLVACLSGVAGCALLAQVQRWEAAVAALGLFMLYTTVFLVVWIEKLLVFSSRSLRLTIVMLCLLQLVWDILSDSLGNPLWLSAVFGSVTVCLALVMGSSAGREVRPSCDLAMSGQAAAGLFAIGLTVGCVQSMAMAAGAWGVIWQEAALALACALVVVLLFVVSDPDYSIAVRAVLFLMFCSLALLVISPQAGTGAFLLTSIAYSVLWCIAYLVAIEMLQGVDQSPVRVLGVVGVMLNGGAVVRLALSALAVPIDGPVALGALIALLAFVSLWVLNDRLFSRLVRPSEEEERSLEAPQSFDSLSECFGLTQREAEVLLLFAQGRSAPFIAEKLMVSLSTVKSHIAHAYAKCGVHSRQELISLIEQK